MKRLVAVLAVLGMFTGVSLVQAATDVTTNAVSEASAADQTVKKVRHHKKDAVHKTAQTRKKSGKKSLSERGKKKKHKVSSNRQDTVTEVK